MQTGFRSVRLVGRGEDARQCFQRMQRWHQELLQLPLLQLKPEDRT